MDGVPLTITGLTGRGEKEMTMRWVRNWKGSRIPGLNLDYLKSFSAVLFLLIWRFSLRMLTFYVGKCKPPTGSGIVWVWQKSANRKRCLCTLKEKRDGAEKRIWFGSERRVLSLPWALVSSGVNYLSCQSLIFLLRATVCRDTNNVFQITGSKLVLTQ